MREFNRSTLHFHSHIYSGREQWKIDFKLVHEKEQQQIRAINQDAAAGIQNRQQLDAHLGGLVHPPGIVGQHPPPRSMNIESINARVASQSGHVIAAPRRESGIIPQAVALAPQTARAQAQHAARIPAVVASEMVINGQRGLNHVHADDPYLAVLAQTISAPAQSNIFIDLKVKQETRQIELQSLMQQHKFAQELPDSFPNKTEILNRLTEQIFGNPVETCAICLDTVPGNAHNTARLPCCNAYLHTSCLSRLLRDGKQPCPLCRQMLA